MGYYWFGGWVVMGVEVVYVFGNGVGVGVWDVYVGVVEIEFCECCGECYVGVG